GAGLVRFDADLDLVAARSVEAVDGGEGDQVVAGREGAAGDGVGGDLAVDGELADQVAGAVGGPQQLEVLHHALRVGHLRREDDIDPDPEARAVGRAGEHHLGRAVGDGELLIGAAGGVNDDAERGDKVAHRSSEGNPDERIRRATTAAR